MRPSAALAAAAAITASTTTVTASTGAAALKCNRERARAQSSHSRKRGRNGRGAKATTFQAGIAAALADGTTADDIEIVGVRQGSVIVTFKIISTAMLPPTTAAPGIKRT